ncbi:hypothetical protein F4677DRAFT_466057 [Hypoxylon crocopeplum]|nr:hypothetical protein F4677DRAFT_466057 [Hypoxylon crocopeplum]
MSSLDDILRQPLPEAQKTGTGDGSNVMTAIQERDGYVHPVLFWQLKNEGRINLFQEDHRALLMELHEMKRPWTKEYVEATVKKLSPNGGVYPKTIPAAQGT